ncbi:MAG: ATP-binding protein [Gordonia sp. (in: high G+C Gram-positive bacteria)]|uniref:ATP-binding protein n=1 Tax=Gordonia sp. (in: high G+C Gram-positive bacteria) TaxID=84139 RepID=UPI003C71BA9D
MNELLMRRVAAVCMGLTTLIVPASLFVSAEVVAQLLASWWVPVSLVLVVGSAVTLLGAAVADSGRWIGPAALLLGAANATALVLLLIAWNGSVAPEWMGSPPVWPANTVALPAVVMVTVYPARIAILYTAGILLLLATAQQMLKHAAFGVPAYTNALLTGALVGVLLTAELAVMDAVRAADRRRDEVLAASALNASRAARIAERQRLDVLVRDEVIAVLRTVRAGTPDPRHRDQAAQTLADLAGRSNPALRPAELSAGQAARRLREAVNDLGDDTHVDVQVTDRRVRYPYPVCEALTDAAVEAVANVVQHAGPGASRALVGVLGEDLIRLRIVDDGVGFDPRRVAADCAGIELGIRGRLREHAGAAAWVESACGEGTMVSLEWRRP